MMVDPEDEHESRSGPSVFIRKRAFPIDDDKSKDPRGGP